MALARQQGRDTRKLAKHALEVYATAPEQDRALEAQLEAIQQHEQEEEVHERYEEDEGAGADVRGWLRKAHEGFEEAHASRARLIEVLGKRQDRVVELLGELRGILLTEAEEKA